MRVGEFAAQEITPLATDGEDLHLLALAHQSTDEVAGHASGVDVEPAGKAAISRDGHDQMLLVATRCRPEA